MYSDCGQVLSLNALKTGQLAVVQSVDSRDTALSHKLATMGIVAGTVVEIRRSAPLGDPIEIRALGYSLCLPVGRPIAPGGDWRHRSTA